VRPGMVFANAASMLIRTPNPRARRTVVAALALLVFMLSAIATITLTASHAEATTARAMASPFAGTVLSVGLSGLALAVLLITLIQEMVDRL